MEDYGYERWVEYIASVFKRLGVHPTSMVDIACGTGNMTIPLVKSGYEMIGIDSSEDMLYVAKEKAFSMGLSIPFIHQDIRNLSLHRPVDAIICMCDGFNYILSDQDLLSVFSKIYALLNDKGILLFDISSYYKLRNILGNNLMADASEDISLIWFNTFDDKDDICRMDLTFFVKKESAYKRFDETHYQRAYRLNDIKNFLLEVGFTKIEVFSPFTFESPKVKDNRWVFIAQKL